MVAEFKPAFTSGEITPAMYGRTDIEHFNEAAELLQNVVVHAHGGLSNRGGTKYLGDAYSATHTSRLIAFTFSVTQAYMLEFSENVMRVWKDGGIVLSGASPYTLATPWDADELINMDTAQSADVLYVAHNGYALRKITRTAHDAWTIAEVAFSDGPWDIIHAGDEDITVTPAARTGNNVSLTASAPLFTSDMVGQPFRVGYTDPLAKNHTQWGYGVIDAVTSSTSARCDVINDFGVEYILDPGFALGEGQWRLYDSGGYSGISGGAYYLHSTTGTQSNIVQKIFIDTSADLILTVDLDVAARPSGTSSMVISVGTYENGSDIFSGSYSVDIGTQKHEASIPSLVTIGFDSDGRATSYAGLAFVSIRLIAQFAFPGTATFDVTNVSLRRQNLEADAFRRPAWTSGKGYPSEVCFHEQRLVLGASVDEPQTFWLSQTGDYEDMAFHTPVQPSDAFSMTLAAKQVNPIKWMLSRNELLAGSGANIWRISSGGDAAISPSEKSGKIASGIGSSNLKPLMIGNILLLAERGGRHVRAIKPIVSGGEDFPDNEVSIRAAHLLAGKSIVSWAYARDPDSIVWAVRSDGVLLGLTYLPEYDVLAWHQHPFTSTDGEAPIVEDVNVIEGLDTDNDDVYLVVKRKIDGSWVRYIEQLMPRIADEDTYDFFLVECGLRYSGAATTAISGLAHLEGEELIVLADGVIVTGLTVSGGAITLPTAASLVIAGLKYNCDVKTLTADMTDRTGASQGKERVIEKAILRVYKSRSCYVGIDADNLFLENFRSIPPEDAGALVSVVHDVVIDDAYNREGSLYLRHSDPVPFTLQTITLDVDYEDVQ